MENVKSHLQGPHKHCYSGALAIGATFLASSCLTDTTELILAIATLGGVALYTVWAPGPVKETTTGVE